MKHFAILVLLAALPTHPASADTVPNTPPHLTQTYDAFEETIAAPCAKVFRLMENPELWIPRHGPLKPTEPPSDYEVEYGKGPDSGHSRYERTIARVPGRKLVVAMAAGELHAYAVQTLRPINSGCQARIEILVGSSWTANIKDEADARRAELGMHRGIAGIAVDWRRWKALSEQR